MNISATGHTEAEKLQGLKKLATTVYVCQVFAVMMIGLPLFVGVALNFFNRDDVQGTWLESHFNWQIKTAWVSLAGFALAGLSFDLGFGVYILLVTVVWLIYRIAIGWYTLSDDQAINNNIN